MYNYYRNVASEFGKDRIKKEVDKIVEKCNQKCSDKEKEPTMSLVDDLLSEEED